MSATVHVGDAPRALTRCRVCDRPVFFVSIANERGENKPVAMDPAAPIYVRESDGEGGAVWARWTTQDAAVPHAATCRSKA